ncbi:MAG: hypothetical protein JNK78_12935 [Planctomycetes bacterium]|nr:hypothetical protein [Planctomycetota bacterium]
MTARRTKRRLGLGKALMLLGLSGAGAVWSMSASSSPSPVDGGTPTVDAAPDDADLQEQSVVDESGHTLRQDLLAEYGSCPAGTRVRMAFATLLDVAIAAAPAVETAAGRRWVGADPPVLQIGVVMVGEAVRRAVVNGVVVGIGDRIADATIVSIERDTLGVVQANRRLTYDFDNGYPREFRGELKRRGTANAETASPAAQPQENR